MVKNMKRIKAMNGYTVMQAVTERDADMYNCEIGCYNVYFSSDIRDYGIRNSYPEFENIDTLEEAEQYCGGNYARAREIVESRTTCATYEEIEEVEKKLDSGMSEIEIEEEEEREEEVKPLRVCEHCLMAIESHEGTQATLRIYVDEEDENESRCDWCEETGFDVLFELI